MEWVHFGVSAPLWCQWSMKAAYAIQRRWRTCMDMSNFVSAQATRAGLRTHSLGQYSQVGEKDIAAVHDVIVESAAVAAELTGLQDPTMRAVFRDLTSLTLWEEVLFSQEALRIARSGKESNRFVFVMATKAEVQRNAWLRSRHCFVADVASGACGRSQKRWQPCHHAQLL